MKRIAILLCIQLVAMQLFAQNAVLRDKIAQIIAGKKADIGVSVIGFQKNDTVQFNGNQLYPMLSTFKFPIALTVLHKVEKGELNLEQKVLIREAELLDGTWSPFKDEHPKGDTSLTLADAMRWMLCYSDNNLTDIILRLIGGAMPVQQFIGSKNFIIRNDEEDMHKNWDAQFINKITPNEAAQLLDKFNKGKILNAVHTKWLYDAMVNNQTGLKRLKGKLPANIKVAHRSGTSFTNEAGMTGAVNSYGIIELPNHKKIIVAVFVHDSYETFNNTEAIIADISKAAFDYYCQKK
ncbi:beta-lactamase class A [Chitinophaga dinghuensis]|uniref:Beta-lactamase n=1 Tax=Chitinophaga dinghuensis TaxID=1539050 RepID=A0A327WDF0_9BACT|nr:class A beta-lactamase [Chitinophaga dinghuensis]RAJ88279.1 beta-lactamase class A [Chitinophaga dinghuensis]